MSILEEFNSNNYVQDEIKDEVSLLIFWMIFV